jgi:hypothetical protein
MRTLDGELLNGGADGAVVSSSDGVGPSVRR